MHDLGIRNIFTKSLTKSLSFNSFKWRRSPIEDFFYHLCSMSIVHTYFDYTNLLLVPLVLFCPYDLLILIMTPTLVPHVQWTSLWSNLGFTLGLMSFMGELVQSNPTICELIICFVGPMVFTQGIACDNTYISYWFLLNKHTNGNIL